MRMAYLRLGINLILFFLLLMVQSYAEEELLLGDVSDGNRSVPVHLIEMFDADSGRIRSDDQPMMPFSTKQTCSPCHNYEKIRLGWHFSAGDSTAISCRPGQPWILVDYLTATQIPLSYRDWPGIFHPNDIKYFKQKTVSSRICKKGCDELPSQQNYRFLTNHQWFSSLCRHLPGNN